MKIGEIIKKQLTQSGITITAFAGKCDMTRANAYDLFDRYTVDTGYWKKSVGAFVQYSCESSL